MSESSRRITIDPSIAQAIQTAFDQAQNIVIMSHRNPDADTVGANLALRAILEKKGKKVTSACVDEPFSRTKFLPEMQSFVTEFNPSDYDLLVAVDAGSIEQVAFHKKYPEITAGTTPFVNIDHHPSNKGYGTINLVIDDAASATIIVYFLMKHWGETITPKIATYLLYGLYYDTGSFKHSNTSEVVLQVAAQLVQLGADQTAIVKDLFKTRPLSQLKVWGKALERLQINKEGVAVAAITKKDLHDLNATTDDISGLIDYVSSAKGSEFGTVLMDTNKGIKGSFRTRFDHIDVAELAAKFGGGGHKKASGFTVAGKLRRTVHWAIDAPESQPQIAE